MRVADLKPGDHFKLATDPRTLRMLAYDNGPYAVAGNDLVAIHPDSWVEPVEPEAEREMGFAVGKLTGSMIVHDNRLEVCFDGYSTHDGHGPLVIYPDLLCGVPYLEAYTEINGVDPTHKLNFSHARK